MFTKMTIGDVLAFKVGTKKDGDPVYWCGEVPAKCQLSGKRIVSRFVDGRIPGSVTWAFVHPEYFQQVGGQLGLGRGQLYERQQTGRWLKIEG